MNAEYLWELEIWIDAEYFNKLIGFLMENKCRIGIGIWK
jgi:hypothetical protein